MSAFIASFRKMVMNEISRKMSPSMLIGATTVQSYLRQLIGQRAGGVSRSNCTLRPPSWRCMWNALTHPCVDTTRALMLGRRRTRAVFGIDRESERCFTKPAAAVPPIERDPHLFRIAAVLVLYFSDVPVRFVTGHPLRSGNPCSQMLRRVYSR